MGSEIEGPPWVSDDGAYRMRNPERFLISWNRFNNDPSKISCVDAVDTALFCYNPPNQFRKMYRTGQPDACIKEWSDVRKCFITRGEATRNPQNAQKMLEEWDYRENEATLEPHIWEFRERPPKQYLILREKLKKKEEEKQREIDEKWEARNKRKEKERQEKEEKERREKEAGDKQRDDPNAGPSLLSGSDGNTGGNSSNVNNNNNSDNKDEDEKQEGDASPKMDYLVQEYEKDMRERTVERYEKPACVIC